MANFLNGKLEEHLESDIEMGEEAESSHHSEQEDEEESSEEEQSDKEKEGTAVGASHPGRTDLTRVRLVNLERHATETRRKLEVRGDGV